MPATTGISATPMGRPGVEAQVGIVPGFYLSESAQNEAGGEPTRHASFLIEPDRWLGLKSLILGARIIGSGGDAAVEPYVGYRRRISDGIAIGGIGFGSTHDSTENRASYHAVRIGGEAAVDGELWAPTSWLGFHAQGAVSATHIRASGTYCADSMGAALDCSNNGPNLVISGGTTGVYPAATATLAVDIARRRDSVFDGVRLSLLGAVGAMPLVRGGEKIETAAYASFGVMLTVGIGAALDD